MNYNQIINEVMELNISGNIVPISWFKTIRYQQKNKNKVGKPYLLAINILSDIVYWYRPREIRDEQTGNLIGYEKKFKADLLQRSYKQIADMFGCSKREATNAVVRLEQLGVVKRHFRTIRSEEFVANNVLFLELIPSILKKLTYGQDDCEPSSHMGLPSTHVGGSPYMGGGAPTFESERVTTQKGRQIQRLHTEISDRNNIYIYDHFSKNDRVSDLAQQGVKVIKETTVPVVEEPQKKRSPLNNRIGISKSQSEEVNKDKKLKKEEKVAAKEEKTAAGNKKAPRVSEKLLNSEFENIWASYPRKQGKKAAQAAFIRARKSGVELDTIASGIEAYVNYIQSKKISQEYIKQGSTFFNQNSWDDEWEMGNKPSMSKKYEEQQDSYLRDLEVAREEARKFNDQKYLKEIDELERKYLEGLKKKEE